MPRQLNKRAVSPKKGERGVALLMVMLMLTLLAAVVADFQYTSQIDLQLAANSRDALQAEYNALSGLRVQALILKNSKMLERAMGAVGAMFGMDSNAMPPLSTMLEQMPVDCSLLGGFLAAKGSERDAGTGEEGSDDAGIFNGECFATSSSEHSKIPLRTLIDRRKSARERVMMMLGGLLVGPAMERHFEEDDSNGVHAESPAELIGAIADWQDRDDNGYFQENSDESRDYAYLEDHYEPKNAPMDSLQELQLVHGVDDELFAKLKDRVSIYTRGDQLELGNLSTEMILLNLVGALPEQLELSMVPPSMLADIYFVIENLRLMSGGFMPLKVAMLRNIVSQYGAGYFDANKVTSLFTDKESNTWYTIESTGTVGNATHHIRAVFQAKEARFYHVSMGY